MVRVERGHRVDLYGVDQPIGPDGPPRVSVVLPTFRRPDALARLLTTLVGQALPGQTWELVIVDNDPAASARDLVAATTAPAGTTVRYVNETTPGSASARNRGIAEALGEVVVLVDDDVVVEDRWLTELVGPILTGEADATAGRVILERPDHVPRWFDYDRLGPYLTHYDLGDAVRWLGPTDQIVSASAAFRTDLLRDVGGFDLELGPSGGGHLVCDDIRVHRKVVAAGGRVRYVPTSLAVHELPPARLTRRFLLSRCFQQGRSDWILDREVLEPMRGNGLRVSLLWLGAELRRRWSEGLWRRSVRFHLLTDLVRVAGNVREMLRWGR